jgi:hypothetical protein
MNGWLLLIVPLHLAIGTTIGLLYFHAIWRSVRQLAGVAPMRATVIAMALRFAILAAALVAISLEGAAPLLAAGAGVMIGRFIVLRSVRRAVA